MLQCKLAQGTSDASYEEGLVDSVDPTDFDSRLQSCRDVWNTQVLPYLGPGQTFLFDYFVHHHASTFRHTMLRDVRVAAGLGWALLLVFSPPMQVTA